MTKAIKFNLTLDKHPVRDLEDLLANFNLDDLLTAYHSQQLLHRWLEVRGLNDELEQLKLIAIRFVGEQEIAAELCKLFQASLSKTEIKAAVYPIVLRQQQEQQLKQLAEQKFSRDAVIEKYHTGYKQLCEAMLDKSSDYSFLKAAIDTLWKDYEQLFCVDFDLFFSTFIEKSPLTLFAMLANDVYRQSNLFDSKRKERLFSCIPSAEDINQVKIFQKGTYNTWEEINPQKVRVKNISNISGYVKIKDDDGNEYVGLDGIGKILNGLHFSSSNNSDSIEYELFPPVQTPYRSYKRTPDPYWKDLEPIGEKCLILKMEDGCLIQNPGKVGEELTAQDVKASFVVLDGINYKSNNANHALVYMVI